MLRLEEKIGRIKFPSLEPHCRFGGLLCPPFALLPGLIFCRRDSTVCCTAAAAAASFSSMPAHPLLSLTSSLFPVPIAPGAIARTRGKLYEEVRGYSAEIPRGHGPFPDAARAVERSTALLDQSEGAPAAAAAALYTLSALAVRLCPNTTVRNHVREVGDAVTAQVGFSRICEVRPRCPFHPALKTRPR